MKMIPTVPVRRGAGRRSQKSVTDENLVKLTEKSLMISDSHSVTHIRSDNAFVDPRNIATCRGILQKKKGSVYSNGLFHMTESRVDKDSKPQTNESGLLSEDAWQNENWELRKRAESLESFRKTKCQRRKLTAKRRTLSKTNQWRKGHACRKPMLSPINGHRNNDTTNTIEWKRTVLSKRRSSRGSIRHRKSRVVRFLIDEDESGRCSGRGHGSGFRTNQNTSKLGMEFRMEEKKAQRALLDLQVGMKHMGL